MIDLIFRCGVITSAFHHGWRWSLRVCGTVRLSSRERELAGNGPKESPSLRVCGTVRLSSRERELAGNGPKE
ncbi:hypothetical protein QE152_g26871 [Popillia japonica]|uniref:Uncharacterized protein n=1 Tax=Popillia japonica TaxID=7064 RepID=A0AAW1JX54_POPJA